MVKITFQTTETLTADTRLNAVARMEGDIRIYLQDTLFADLPRTHLVDFAAFAQRWLHDHSAPSVAYQPMDREEAVLQIEQTADGLYRLKGAEGGYSGAVAETEISGAFEAYLADLEDKLHP